MSNTFHAGGGGGESRHSLRESRYNKFSITLGAFIRTLENDVFRTK